MQGGAADAGAGQGHGLEFGHGRHHPGATHLAAEPQQFAGGLLSGVFEGDRPAGRLLGKAGAVLQAQVIEFHHHPIGGVGQGLAGPVPVAEEGLHRGQVGQALGVGVDAETSRLQPLQGLSLALGPPWIGSSGLGLPVGWQMQGVGEEIQAPGCHHPRIELAQGAGAGVAGVGEGGFALRQAVLVDGGKGGIGDQGLAAHLHPGRGMGQLQPQGHAGDRAHVGGDLLAALTVPPGGGPHQQAVLVAQGQGVAIDLELPHHLQGRQGTAGFPLAVEHLEQAAVPGLQLFEAEGVIEAE